MLLRAHRKKSRASPICLSILPEHCRLGCRRRSPAPATNEAPWSRPDLTRYLTRALPAIANFPHVEPALVFGPISYQSAAGAVLWRAHSNFQPALFENRDTCVWVYSLEQQKEVVQRWKRLSERGTD